MGLTALLAAAVMPLGAAQAGPPVEYAIDDAFGAAVTDGGLFYVSVERRRGVIRRLDLASRAEIVVFTAPDRLTHISELDAGGGRVAFETLSDTQRVFALDAAGGAVEQLASGRDGRHAECGRLVRLLDISDSGEVLYDDVRVPCATSRGRHRVQAELGGRTRTLVSRPADSTFLSMGEPFRFLAGNQLVTWGPETVRVRDLDTGAVRHFRPPDRLTHYSDPSVAADGRVLLTEFRHMGRNRRPRETIRLVRGSGNGRILHRTRRAFTQAAFCGARAVLGLDMLDGPLRGLRNEDGRWFCDARHWVWASISGADRERAYVRTLPE